MKILSSQTKLLLFVSVFTIPNLLSGQPSTEEDILDNPVPFDGWIIFLIIAVTLYKLFKVVQKKKVQIV